MKWLMNMPVSPVKDASGDYSPDWLAWVKSRHPVDTDKHVQEWTKFLADKVIGEPKSQAQNAAVYKKAGWVGIYQGIYRV